jgi:DNA polymerase-1
VNEKQAEGPSGGLNVALLLDRFRQLSVVDFEFIPQTDGTVRVICCAWLDLRTNRTFRLWHTEFGKTPPYGTGPDCLFIAYQASAEASCHLALGWPRPEFILDLYNEHRWLVNGETVKPTGTSLLRAASDLGIPCITKDEKKTMRDLVPEGGHWSQEDQKKILDYCEGDVVVTAQVFSQWKEKIDLPRATLRGRYSYALALVERTGVPFNEELRNQLKNNLSRIKTELIAEVDKDFNAYIGDSFNTNKFVEYLNRNDIEWPMLPSGHICLDDDAFEERAKVYRQLLPLRYLRGILSKQRILDFPVGSDGRNRAYMNPFWTVTGRNMPRPNEFILGAPAWLRGLVKPREGEAFAVLDYVAQEFGIAAVLSGDVNMIQAYESDDIYLWFAVKIGDAPPGATKKTHGALRDRYKPCILGLQYEIQEHSLAEQLQRPTREARRLLRLHREIFPRYWQWLEDVKNHAFIHAFQFATYGWRKRITDNCCNDRAAGNFHSQANGGEMLRLATIYATEAGVPVCGLMHDAIAIVSPAERIEADVTSLHRCMDKASEMVLEGYKLRVEPTIVHFPNRYMKEKGQPMWKETMQRL